MGFNSGFKGLMWLRFYYNTNAYLALWRQNINCIKLKDTTRTALWKTCISFIEINLSMRYRKIIAVCYEIYTEHTNKSILCGKMQSFLISDHVLCIVKKKKAIPLQTWTGPEGSRRLRLPDCKSIGTWRW